MIGDDIAVPNKLVLQVLQTGLENGRESVERQWLAVALTQGLGIPQRIEVIGELLVDVLAKDQNATLAMISGAFGTVINATPTPEGISP